MYLSVDHIEGVSPYYQKKLENAGVKTVSEFLAVTKTQEQRNELSHRCGIKVVHINKWASVVDLSRVDGVGFQYAHLLINSGVTSVGDLRKRNPDNLHKIIRTTKERGTNKTSQLPSVELLDKFISSSKALTNILTP